MGSKPGVMSRITNEQLTEEPRESSDAWCIFDNQNQFFERKNISLFTIFDLSTPLRLLHIYMSLFLFMSVMLKSCLKVTMKL